MQEYIKYTLCLGTLIDAGLVLNQRYTGIVTETADAVDINISAIFKTAEQWDEELDLNEKELELFDSRIMGLIIDWTNNYMESQRLGDLFPVQIKLLGERLLGKYPKPNEPDKRKLVRITYDKAK